MVGRLAATDAETNSDTRQSPNYWTDFNTGERGERGGEVDQDVIE